MNSWYKNKIFLILVAILVIGGIWFAVRGGDEGGNDREDDKTSLEEGEIEVRGEIACLPYNINVSDQGCVKSLKGDDGKVYALNSIKVKGIENTMDEGTKVVAVGVFEEANTSVDDSSVFSYDGVLVLSSLKKR